jgi:hypothetical protein
VHPSDENDVHELFLMCDDVQALIPEMKKKDVKCSPVDEPALGARSRGLRCQRRETRRLPAEACVAAEGESDVGRLFSGAAATSGVLIIALVIPYPAVAGGA